MKIDLLIADNRYGSTLHFAKGLRSALERAGVCVRTHWIADGHFYHAFYEIMRDPPDLTLSFSDVTMGQGISLGNFWKIPHFSYLLDPAIYFLHHFQGNFSWVSCVDQGDSEFVRQMGFAKASFLPHGVDRELKTAVSKSRPLDLVFFGSCIDYEQLEASWKKRFSTQEEELLRALCHQVLTSSISTLDALVNAGIKEDKLLLYHHEIDLYTRGRDRVELLRAMKGMPLSVWGHGNWKKYLPEARIYPSIPFEQTLTIMQEAKCLLNSSPRFKRGFHERIFYALACGSCILTGQSALLSENFEEGSELLTYRYGYHQEAAATVRAHLNQFQSIAEKGQEKVLCHHTWDQRVEQLLSICHVDSLIGKQL